MQETKSPVEELENLLPELKADLVDVDYEILQKIFNHLKINPSDSKYALSHALYYQSTISCDPYYSDDKKRACLEKVISILQKI